MKKLSLFLVLILSVGLLGCNRDKLPSHGTEGTTDNFNETQPQEVTYTLPEDFVYPKTDGSTSTINLDNAIKSAILGGEQVTSHTKTYTSFYNLLDGTCELIFTTPLSADQLQTMVDYGFSHEAEPIAGEGFVFVVNKDNPVDTLTVEQLKGIYSGEITNWSEVGGRDAEIVAYQRNSDSGSQNYMISFMGDTPLMKPITDEIPATMSGILDVVANYDNGIDAIGYSVYAYSDGMYENISEIKYIKVNGVEPSLTTLADGSYPLLGYNYAVFSADEPEDSHVRALVKWIQSDEGQKVIANAGYIPYRKVAGLTLPEGTNGTLYTAVGTSGTTMPELAADYFYQCYNIPSSFTTDGLDEAIADFIAEATDELSTVDEAKMREFLASRAEHTYSNFLIQTEKKLVNGYLSVTVSLRYMFGWDVSPDYYYDVRTAVFDIYSGERLELSDLFFEGVNFVPILNQHLAKEAVTPYSGFGTKHDMLRDFTGLYEGDFAFTADSIIFYPGSCFADGVELSLDGVYEYMVTSIPRDMSGLIDEEIPVRKILRSEYNSDIGYAEEKNGISIWYLDKDKAPVSGEVCGKVNAFIDKIYEDYFTEEKLLAYVKSKGVETDKVSVGPFPDFDITLVGNRYVELFGANLVFAGGAENREFVVIEGHTNYFYFTFYLNAKTGEELRIGDLFSEGWIDHAEYYAADENFNWYDQSSAAKYTGEFDANECRILSIVNYDAPPNDHGDLSDLKWPATIYLITENGDQVAVCVPREFIK